MRYHQPRCYTEGVKEKLIASSEAARALGLYRKRVVKVCPVCGTEFEGMTKQVYDRHACQQKAYELRRKKKQEAAVAVAVGQDGQP